MNERIVEVGEMPTRVSLKDGLIRFESPEAEAGIPPADLAAVVLAHPQASITVAALSALAEAGAAVVGCDSKRLPVLLGLPICGHSTQTERIRIQWECGLPRRKRVWQAVVRRKILHQAHSLRVATGATGGLDALASKVRSGDPDNLEAIAAARYWGILFGPGFVRDPEGAEPNGPLNYGYALVRSGVARALVAAGLHPSVGIHHHNRYDPFCLADDMMEPFRPDVDLVVKTMFAARGDRLELDSITKRELVAAILGPRNLEGERRRFADVCERVAVSLVRCLEGSATEPVYPEPLQWPSPESSGTDPCGS